ncbi:hypothetical protein MTR_6g488210 [Medicago truncatula]|uniref:Uncharacterized protein n=1 Tax=Medicago truncatula TaxID=3880 RepID=A0A072UBG3_MEDTR|nr:hypothetical protein MTR_6g488210 [Medicago truncatula]
MVEVHIAMFFMQFFKATRSDGFQPIFSKHIWDVEGEYVRKYAIKLLRYYLLFRKRAILSYLRNFCTSVSLIFKVNTKVLVNRIRPFLDNMIGFFQSSFILGRGTNY